MEDDLEIKITRKIVYKASTEELDFLLADTFVTEDEKNKTDHYFTTNIDDNKIYLDSHEVPINVMRTMLDRAEANGANFVAIDYHCDHIEYDVYGLKIERASAEVVDEAREKEIILDEARKQARILELKKELKQLEG